MSPPSASNQDLIFPEQACLNNDPDQPGAQVNSAIIALQAES
jgi:hypothetical protein